MNSRIRQAINLLTEFGIKTKLKMHKSGAKLNMITLEDLKNEKRRH
jgi:hypothetical protein